MNVRPDLTLETQPKLYAKISDLVWLLLRIMSAAPRPAMLWVGMSILGGLSTPIQLWATKGIADNLQLRLEGQSGDMMWWFAVVWMVVIISNLIAIQAENNFAATARERGGSAIAAETLAKTPRIDLALFEHQKFYDKVALVLTNAEQKANDALQQFMQFGWWIPRSVAWASVLIVFDWRLFLLAIVPLLPAAWGWFFSGAAYWDVYHGQTRERRLAAYYASLLTDRQAAKELRLFGLAGTLVDRWEAAHWAAARALRNQGLRIGLRQRGLSQATLTIQLLGFAWFISVVPEGTSAGTAVVITSSFMSFYGGFINLGSAVQTLGQVSGFASNLRAFLALPEESERRTRAASSTPPASKMRLDGVTFSYPGAMQPSLVNISMTISPGETIALVGENGAGKTTLVKIMLGLYQPDQGQVFLDDVDLATLDPSTVRRHLSGVFQHFTRYPVSARQNVTLGEHHPESSIQQALDLAGLPYLADHLSDGLDTLLSPDLGGTDLSGGQWQRLAIARAGVRNASFLALDEPTAALDPLAEVEIFKRFAELARDRTTILVSHRLGMARLADRIIVLEKGQIIDEGTHDDLIARPRSEYAAMWAAQARWYQ